MEINLFRLCSGLKAIGYFMILLVAAIVSVSYYAVIVLTWGPELLLGGLHSVLAIVIIVLFHFLVNSQLFQ
jgi:palmitoyltransferase